LKSGPTHLLCIHYFYNLTLKVAKLAMDTSTNLKIQRLLTLAIFLLIAATATTAWANDAENNAQSNELNEQQQKLKQILSEIADTREQRTEQKILLEKLNKKMECNWALIKDYDACDKKYKDQKTEQLSCVQKAKSLASECLSEIDNLQSQ